MFCAYTRPRYQVSVYRTIGPLVCIFTWRISTALKTDQNDWSKYLLDNIKHLFHIPLGEVINYSV